MIFTEDETSRWLSFANERRDNSYSPTNSMEAFVSGYRIGLQTMTKSVQGYKLMLVDSEDEINIIDVDIMTLKEKTE